MWETDIQLKYTFMYILLKTTSPDIISIFYSHSELKIRFKIYCNKRLYEINIKLWENLNLILLQI